MPLKKLKDVEVESTRSSAVWHIRRDPAYAMCGLLCVPGDRATLAYAGLDNICLGCIENLEVAI